MYHSFFPASKYVTLSTIPLLLESDYLVIEWLLHVWMHGVCCLNAQLKKKETIHLEKKSHPKIPEIFEFEVIFCLAVIHVIFQFLT